MQHSVEVYSLFTDFDVNLFQAGKHHKLYEKFGAHAVLRNDIWGTYFAVWAPNAESVSVIGNLNGWNPYAHTLIVSWDGSGIWEGFIPDLGVGELYIYDIRSNKGETNRMNK